MSPLVYHQFLPHIFVPEVKEGCRAFSHGMRTYTLQVASRFSKGIQVKPRRALAANLSPAASEHPGVKVRVAAASATAANQISSCLTLIPNYF